MYQNHWKSGRYLLLWVLISFSVLVLVFHILFVFEQTSEKERILFEKLSNSVPQDCTPVVIHGPRGEIHKGYIVRLLDKDAVVWTYQIKSSHALAAFCERKPSVATGEQK